VDSAVVIAALSGVVVVLMALVVQQARILRQLRPEMRRLRNRNAELLDQVRWFKTVSSHPAVQKVERPRRKKSRRRSSPAA
jgi:hypothetical protein